MEIATLTVNPAIDLSFEAQRIFHTHKMRGDKERHDPGGGGINVARVFVRLGGTARCFYLSGGAAGAALDHLLDVHQLARCRIPIAGETRISTAIFEQASAKEYRFSTSGPSVSRSEWEDCLERLAQARGDYIVASGSLAPGVPDDFYDRVARVAAQRGARTILDSSGRGLAGGLAGHGVFLVKPSLGELRALTGDPLEDDRTVAEAAAALVRQGAAQHVAVSMAHEGAMLVNASGTLRLPAIAVKAASSVGAGDSFVAGMVFALASGRDIDHAFRYGMAAGAAAVLTPGTSLAYPADIERFAREGAVAQPIGSFG
ncbi:1-phosphofructokinase family hexose kinase [Sphingopyxis chilensis]